MTVFIITSFVTFADLLNLSEPLALTVGRDHNTCNTCLVVVRNF